MTALRDPDTDNLIGIVCDEPNCSIRAPDDDSLIAKHNGLIGMGWYCRGGKHLCPDHAEQE